MRKIISFIIGIAIMLSPAFVLSSPVSVENDSHEILLDVLDILPLPREEAEDSEEISLDEIWTKAAFALWDIGIIAGYSQSPAEQLDRPVARAGMAALVSRFYGAPPLSSNNIYIIEIHDLNDEERLAEFERVKNQFNLEYINIVWQSDIHPGMYGVDVVGDRSVFADVERTHWAIGILHYVYDKGIITGDGDGNFRPNDDITEREAVTMVVRALGYSEQAQSLGGFPYGYIQIAEELGLFEHTTMDIAAERRESLRGNVIMLLYNAIQYQAEFE
ncbi:MAG: S-layer homology domain-containing protein [Oscillospiraceae bacterium]|nr:S-layer homology domain-containing protein [Oscillospiraceae bacterium]